MAAIETTKNMRLLAQHELNGFGNVGEGMVIQLARDGRRVLWLAHESAPKNLTALDVGDPRKPSVIFQSDLPHADMRSNSLDLAGDLLVVAYQTKAVGMQPAGVEIFDVADPTRPKRVGFFDASGPHSRGTHHLWFVDGQTLHIASGAADFQPRNPKDDQCYRSVDLRNPAKPVEIGRWWLPGTREGDAEPAPVRHTRFDAGFRAHNTNVYPKRPDRAWIGYLDGGAVILDISETGLRVSSDASHEVGQILRIQVPGADAGGAELTVDAAVVWQKRNDINRFGRWSCGLTFKPAIQAGIPTLLSIHWAQAYAKGSGGKTPPPGGDSAG
jgi:hypothetical protein